MPQFHETLMGQKFFSSDIPNIARALNKIADAMEKQNKEEPISLPKKRCDNEILKEIETVLRTLQFRDKNREWSEEIVERLFFTRVISDRCITNKEIVTEDIILTALMEVVFHDYT